MGLLSLRTAHRAVADPPPEPEPEPDTWDIGAHVRAMAARYPSAAAALAEVAALQDGDADV